MSDAADFERLGAFYLGRRFDLADARRTDEPVLYDSKDLTTHAVVVGMTGSGKTGLCIDLLEEAAIDGIPSIAIDPKGDIGNLLLTFPDLSPDDFRPWIDESRARREGSTPEEFAARTARMWRDGLAEWGQTPDRIRRLREAAEFRIYTPGSSAGLPLTVLQNFSAPPPAVAADPDALRERITSAASGLLALMGIDADPINGREHILLSNIFHDAWTQGQNLTLPDLFRRIQKPPFTRVGILDLESFYSENDRADLALRLNNLLASPTFAGWLDGEPLDVHRLLHAPDGRPRVSVLSIAHLSDEQRMFFVTLLLNEVLSWMRSQPGTSSLRALLYMDEVYGFFPPTANPPSKTPMLTLLKQARAYGLGCVLATQNPVDLDYKGLSNAGTWFLGRLQTERDKARVLEGLEGASLQAGASFDRRAMDRMLSAMGSRVFLMNNVHDDVPIVFETRWAMSYLGGPLTRDQIRRLAHAEPDPPPEAAPDTAPVTGSATSSGGVSTTPARDPTEPGMAERKAPGALDWDLLQGTGYAATASPKAAAVDSGTDATHLPIVSTKIDQQFVEPTLMARPGDRIVYRAGLAARCHVHYVRATYQVDEWRRVILSWDPAASVEGPDWDGAIELADDRYRTGTQAPTGVEFAPLPPALADERNYGRWSKDTKDYLYRRRPLVLFRYDELELISHASESESEFRERSHLALRERRDLDKAKIDQDFAKRLGALQEKIQRAENRVATEKEQLQGKTFDSMVSVGSSLLGALLGRKLTSVTNVGRASTAAKSVGRASRERDDVVTAERELNALKQEFESLDAEYRRALDEIATLPDARDLELQSIELPPRKSDVQIEAFSLVWLPYRVDAAGIAVPLYEFA